MFASEVISQIIATESIASIEQLWANANGTTRRANDFDCEEREKNSQTKKQ